MCWAFLLLRGRPIVRKDVACEIKRTANQYARRRLGFVPAVAQDFQGILDRMNRFCRKPCLMSGDRQLIVRNARTTGADRHGINVARHSREGLEITHRILGIDHPGDEEQRSLTPVLECGDSFGNDEPGTRIMSAVEPYFRPRNRQVDQLALDEPLHARWPLHR